MTEAGRPALVAVDWGTSSLRVWLLDGHGAVLGEARSNEGMQKAREIGFAPVLDRVLTELSAPAGLATIVCGMAGARQGWIEAPYAEVPCTLDHIFDGAIAVPYPGRDVKIVPGLAQTSSSSPDVMRGEETQIAGAVGNLGSGRHVVCMPGTHSKWVEIENGRVTGFTSWMTGEVFNLFAVHSILSHSIGDAATGIKADDPAFAEGLARGLDEPDRVTSLTFGIRAATLLHGLPPGAAAARLSGILIGAEIASARKRYLAESKEVILVASGRLGDVYAFAVGKAGLSARLVDADEAVRAGLLHAARVNGMVPEVSA
ncbi:MAG: 2-dehydro-3-deoxygalactonokinase [Rhizobiaceae bacterium]